MRNNFSINTTIIVNALLLLLLSNSAMAITGFDSDGVLAIRGEKEYSSSGDAAVINSGEFFKVWTENDSDYVFRVYIQGATPEGDLIYADGPFRLTSGNTHAYSAKAAALSNGDLVVCWLEYAARNRLNLRTQRLNADGETLWGENGLVVDDFGYSEHFNYNITPDYEAGAYIWTTTLSDLNLARRIYAFDENGEVRDGLDGMQLNIRDYDLYATPGGSCWIFNKDDANNPRLNRISSEGGFIWERSITIDPPEEDMTFYRVTSDGLSVFGLFGHSEFTGFNYGVTVYDTSGEAVSSEIIHSREIPERFAGTDYSLYAENGTMYLSISVFIRGGREIHRGWPYIIRYDPYAESRLPWGGNGIGLSSDGDDIPNVAAFGYHLLGENLVVSQEYSSFDDRPSPHRIWVLDNRGRITWDGNMGQWVLLQTISEPTYSNGELVWFDGGENCWAFNDEGEILSVDNDIRFTPDYQSDPGYITGHPSVNGDYTILGYSGEGLYAQLITSDGEREFSLSGNLIDPDWIKPVWGDIFDFVECGRVGSYYCLFRPIYPDSGRLAMIDDNYEFRCNRQLNLPPSDQNRNPKSDHIIWECGEEHFLLNRYRQRNLYDLKLFNLNGDEEATMEYEDRFLYDVFNWENAGVALVLTKVDSAEVKFLDNDLNDIWEEAVVFPISDGISYVCFKLTDVEDNLRLIRLGYNSGNDTHTAYFTEIDSDGELVAEDSLLLLAGIGTPGSWSCYPADNGSVWFHGKVGNELSVLQGINADGERFYGDDGFSFEGDSRFVADGDGGCWILWEDPSLLRALHFNAAGHIYRDIYPADGIAVLDQPNYSLLNATLDPQTGRVWLALLKEDSLLGMSLPQELRVQVIGDEWVGAPTPCSDEFPTEFGLFPAYPNPFNSSTTISFTLPTQSPVTLQVYNIRGQLVDLVVDQVMDAGRHSVVWDGGGLSTGVYFVRMLDIANDREDSQKILLMK